MNVAHSHVNPPIFLPTNVYIVVTVAKLALYTYACTTGVHCRAGTIGTAGMAIVTTHCVGATGIKHSVLSIYQSVSQSVSLLLY